MATTAQIIPLKARQSACSGCGFYNQCVAFNDSSQEKRTGHSVGAVPRVVHRGDHLFRTGESMGRVYMVRSGFIKTYVILQEGSEQVLGFHYPGDTIGLDAIACGHHICNAVVLDTSSVCPVSFEQLCRSSSRSPEIQRRLIRTMSREIMDHEELQLILGQKTAEQRIAAFLLRHSKRQRQLGLSPVQILLPMSRADVATYLSLAVETVSRVLTRLQEAGLLHVQRSQVAILDLDGLAAIAKESIDDDLPSRRTGMQVL